MARRWQRGAWGDTHPTPRSSGPRGVEEKGLHCRGDSACPKAEQSWPGILVLRTDLCHQTELGGPGQVLWEPQAAASVCSTPGQAGRVPGQQASGLDQ